MFGLARAASASLLLVAAACSYDGSGQSGTGLPTSSGESSSSSSTGAPTTGLTTTGVTTTGLTTGSTTHTTPASTTGTTEPVDPTTTGSTGTTDISTTDVSTTTTSTTSDTATTSTDTSTTTTDGSSTTGEPPPPALVDDGLVVRYFLDEAMGGKGPTHALDAAPQPLDLPLVYENMGGMNPVYAEIVGNRGLRWPSAGLDGRATVPVMATKVQTRLDTSTSATFEVVLDVDAVTDQGSRFVHVGAGAEPGQFTLRTIDLQHLQVFWKSNVMIGYWAVDWVALGRVVVHVVIETSQPDPIDRVRLYVNGAAVADAMDANLVTPAMNEAITIPATSMNLPVHFTLGNRGVDVDRSFGGVLHYAAIYDLGMPESDITVNAGLLAADDDKP